MRTGKKRDHDRHHDLRRLAEPEPGDEEWREDDLRDGLERDDIRVEDPLGRPPDGEEYAKQEADEAPDHKGQEDLG